MAATIRFFGKFRNQLGESTVWEGKAGLLYRVDTMGRIIWIGIYELDAGT